MPRLASTDASVQFVRHTFEQVRLFRLFLSFSWLHDYFTIICLETANTIELGDIGAKSRSIAEMVRTEFGSRRSAARSQTTAIPFRLHVLLFEKKKCKNLNRDNVSIAWSSWRSTSILATRKFKL